MRERGQDAPPFLSLTNWEISLAEKVVGGWIGKKRRRPTAIVCANDFLAAVAIRTARGLGLRTPDDLSVTGFSDSSMCGFLDPPLTSVAQPFEEIGRRCGRILIKMIDAGQRPARQASHWEFVPNTLVERSSTTSV